MTTNSDAILNRMEERIQNQYDVAGKIIQLLSTIETLDPEITQHIKTLEVEASILRAKSRYQIREAKLAEKMFSNAPTVLFSDDDSGMTDEQHLQEFMNSSPLGDS